MAGGRIVGLGREGEEKIGGRAFMGLPIVFDGDGAAEEGFELVALGLLAGSHGV